MRMCERPSCDDKHYAKGLCSYHYHKKYRLENREKVRENRINYYYCNRKELLKRRRKYYRDNKEKILAYQREREPEYRKNRIKKQNLKQLKEGVLEANVRGDDESLFNDAEFLEFMGLSCSLKKEDGRK